LTTKTLKLQKTKTGVGFNWATFFVIGVASAWIIVWLVRLIQNINMPQIEYSEGLMQYNSYLFSSGQWSWNIAQPNGSYHVAYYTPMYYWIWGGLMNLFGDTLIVGRFLTLACFLVCCFLVYLIVNHITQNKTASLIGSVLPLCFSLTANWSWFARCDFMAVMFDLAGIYLALKFWKSSWIYASIPLFLLAFLTKQSTLGGLVAVTIALFISKRYNGISYGLLCIAGILIILGVGNQLTGGEFFRQIFLFQKTYPTFRDNFIFLIVAGYLELIPLLILSYFYAKNNIRSLLTIYAVVAILISIVTITRPGGAANYLFEAIMALIIVSSCALPGVLKAKKYVIAVFLIPVVYLFLGSQLPLYPDLTYRQRVADTQKLIQDTNFPILTDNFNLVYTAGKVPYYEPFVFSDLAHFGYWDGNILYNDLTSHRIQYVITQYPVGSDKVRRIDQQAEKLILQNYHIVYDYSDTKYNPTFVVYEVNNG
jgi:hypothetical protein